MPQRASSEEYSDSDVSRLLDPTLIREHRWDYAPPLLEMWAAFAWHYRQKGVLRELLLRGPSKGEVSAIAVTAGWQSYEAADQAPTQDPPEPPTGGFLHLLPPFHADEDVWVTGIFAGVTPWQAPSLAGLKVVPESDPNAPRVIVTFEHPAEVFITPEPLDKRARDLLRLKQFKERMHLDRYCTDHLLATGVLPYESVANGADPPDFAGQAAGEDRAIECTQFTVRGRRQAHGLFKAVRQAVLVAARDSREQFARLHGCVVYMYFGGGSGPIGLPPRDTDSEAIAEIIDALAHYDADPLRLWVERGAEMPERPDLAPTTTAHGCTLYAVPMALAAPVTSFFVATGFELGFGMPTTHRPAEAWEDIIRLIERKDKEGADDLLITASGPEEAGFSFPSEQWIATLGLEGPRAAPATRHLKRVRLHFWNTGRIVELVPEVKEVASPKFPLGFIPPHLLAALPEPQPEQGNEAAKSTDA